MMASAIAKPHGHLHIALFIDDATAMIYINTNITIKINSLEKIHSVIHRIVPVLWGLLFRPRV